MTEPLPYARSWALEDCEILRAGDGGSDGRTVTAYAAVFDTSTEIQDQHGHYLERIDRRAFNRQIGLGLSRVQVFYNHALTIHGTPASGLGSIPIGSPVDITADSRGLRTVTRFNRSEMADGVLEAIRNGDIKGYSFRGRIYKSSPDRVPRVTRAGGLPTITRTELGLSEYGPTPSPAYMDADIVAVRAALLNAGIPIERALHVLAPTTPDEEQDQETPPATSAPEPGDARDQPTAERSEHLRVQQLKLRLRARLLDKGL